MCIFYFLMFYILERLASLQQEVERRSEKESKAVEDNRNLVERISILEKECAGLELEKKSTHNLYQQEVRAHEETRKSLIQQTKQDASPELVKGNTIIQLLY